MTRGCFVTLFLVTLAVKQALDDSYLECVETLGGILPRS